MSCIATLYVLPEAERAAFLSAHEREPRIEEKKVLFLKFRCAVAGEHVWEFIDRVAVKKIDLEFSGYLLVDYLFVYLGIKSKDYFDRQDERDSVLSRRGAVALAAFLQIRPVDRAAIDGYLTKDGRPLAESERDGTLVAYEKAHASLLEWCEMVTEESFGVLHLSF